MTSLDPARSIDSAVNDAPARLCRQGRLAVDDAPQRLLKLCVHFAKKGTVDYERGSAHGVVHFAWGDCRMRAHADALTFECEATDAAALARVCDVIDAHVALLSRHKPVSVAWERGAG